MSNQNFSLLLVGFWRGFWLFIARVSQQMRYFKTSINMCKFKGGYIRLNGVEVTVRERIDSSDTVTVLIPPEQASEGLLPGTDSHWMSGMKMSLYWWWPNPLSWIPFLPRASQRQSGRLAWQVIIGKTGITGDDPYSYTSWPGHIRSGF